MNKRIAIKEICDVYDGPHATPKKTANGPVYLGIDAITSNGKLNSNSFSYLSEKDFIKWTKRVTPQKDDIVFSYEATLGRYAIIPQDFYGCLGRRLAIVRNKSKNINVKWLYYYFQSPEWKAFIESKIVKGSTVNRISVEDFPSYTVPLIDIKNQDKIVSILSTIDDKIENNNLINDNLQQQLKLLYDYWFTQFDFPDENGKPYKSSGGLMLSNDKVSYKMPANWTVYNLFENPLTLIIKPGVDMFESKNYLATADVNGTAISTGTVIFYETRESRANMQPTVNSVWFAKMKNSVKHLYLNKEMQKLITNSILSTGFCGLQCTEESFEYVAAFIEHSYFEPLKDTLAHGATQEAVNNDDLSGIAFVVPPKRILHLFHESTESIYSQISKNLCENQELTQLREWLLPMLMNGQATIYD
mgnify:CR=1 FL=1